MSAREHQHVIESAAALAKVQAAFDAYQRAVFPERTAQFFALELAGEAGEVANNEKKVWRGDDISRAQLEDEAADVLIALMNYANSNKIDLAEAVGRKLAVIEERRQKRNDGAAERRG